MSANGHGFVSWEEHIICHERGSRVVHFYLKDKSGTLVLAVVGTERSIRHMIYVVSDEFLNVCGSEGSINASMKWRARREVVDWLTLLVSKCQPPLEFPNSQVDDSTQDFGSLHLLTSRLTYHQTYLPDHMVIRKLKVQNSDIEWSGIAWNCTKQLKHYPSFCRNGTVIAVHSFVFITAEEESHRLGYVEDMYEDKKGQKKVKLRWFHHNKEFIDVIPDLNPHPREVFITTHVQVISAECVDGLATVLTPRHYEECVAVVPHTSPSSIYMCFRQIKNKKVKPFTLTKLRGYSSQAIVSSLGGPPVPKQKARCRKLENEDEKQLSLDDPARVSTKRSRNCKGQGLEGGFGVKNSSPVDQNTSTELKCPKFKLRLSRKRMGIKVVLPQSDCPTTFKVDEKIELLCQDSGIRGCWFRCKVMQASQKLLKVKYDDVEDADGSGNLEEWVPASRVAAPDKLGMRCQGRLTIRPCPSVNAARFNSEVGAPVDTWWSGGWWEGVVIGVDVSGDDVLRVYLPGEDKVLSVQRQNVRASKDWVGNKWVDVRGNPNILSYVSANFKSSLRSSVCSAINGALGDLNTALPEQEVLATSKIEAVEEGKPELAGLVVIDDLKNVKESDMRKLHCHKDEDKIVEVGGRDDNEDSNDKAELVLKDSTEPAKTRGNL
ncbi:hypothetical protein CISIN_1g006118mg [Citrus sinensis]|uniref:BAH domain-containing protein n=2 Tax=Citrus sinensis TaxID=2711 RepID=A0A067GFV6_CITSI|nr:hypothetical protein CISIN_1g006118mg [Citrus sinensis]